MLKRILRAFIVLPGAALVVPALILAGTHAAGAPVGWIGFAAPTFWLALAIALGGLALAGWTLRLLVAEARSPSALMDPAGKLAIRGPYRHCRNPLVSAAILLLAAEALLFDSWPIALWLALFYLANAIYIPKVEEAWLEKRFGAAWRRYKAHVPRWFPTPQAYDPDEERQRMTGRLR